MSSEEEPIENLCEFDNKNLKNLNIKYTTVFYYFLLF